MPFKRRRIGKTDYKKRLALSSSGKPRLVIRKSLNYITAQVIEFSKNGDRTLVSATSKELKKMNWNFATDNLPSAYLVGLLIGRKAGEKGIKEVILDQGLYSSTKGSRVYACVKGILDSGLKISIDQKVLPSDERIRGEHIASFLEKYKSITKEFERIKQMILK